MRDMNDAEATLEEKTVYPLELGLGSRIVAWKSTKKTCEKSTETMKAL
jgi:hypothetical protein